MIPKKLIKEFDLKLSIHNGYSAIPMMVTDTDFNKNVYDFAHDKGIKLMNGKELRKFEKNNVSYGNSLLEDLVYTGIKSIIKKINNS